MENRNIGHNNAQKHSQNPKYSRLAAKIIQNNVKRKILEIKRRGEPAADELLDMLTQKIAEGLKSRSANKIPEHIYENHNASSDDITSIDNKSIVNSEKRSHQVTCPVSAENLQVRQYNFLFLCTSANDRGSIESTGFRVTGTFQQAGKFTDSESMNNEDQLYQKVTT